MKQYIFEVRTRSQPQQVLQSGFIRSDLPSETFVRLKIAKHCSAVSFLKDVDWFVDTVEVPLGSK